jgi:hypothetical protein
MPDIGIEMKKKSIVLALILIIASAGVGTGFSLAVGAFRTNGELDYLYDVEFISIYVIDNEVEKDVAIESAYLIDNNHSQVSITNAYPGYVAYVYFEIENIGNDPVIVTPIVVGTYDTNAIDVQATLNLPSGPIFFPGQVIDGELIIEVKQTADMNSYYPFEAVIHFEGSPQ